MVELLLDQGADVHHRDNRGWQPLHAALRAARLSDSERIAIVTLLLRHGADPNAANRGGWQNDSNYDSSPGFRWELPNRGNTPLAVATSNGFAEIAEILKQHGATAGIEDE